MSRVEKHMGRLKKIDMAGKTLEQWCEDFCRSRGMTSLTEETSTYTYTYDSWLDAYNENYSTLYESNYVIFDDEIYELVDHTEDEYMDIEKFWMNDDGTISFVCEFYNGGTCLEEIIDDNLSKLLK